MPPIDFAPSAGPLETAPMRVALHADVSQPASAFGDHHLPTGPGPLAHVAATGSGDRIDLETADTPSPSATARLCAAIVDRLTFGGNIIETGTDSYRLAHTKAKQAAN